MTVTLFSDKENVAQIVLNVELSKDGIPGTEFLSNLKGFQFRWLKNSVSKIENVARFCLSWKEPGEVGKFLLK